MTTTIDMTDIATEVDRIFRQNYSERRADLPDLNVELLFDLLAWARHDEAKQEKFRTWAYWDQGVWGKIEPVTMAEADLNADSAEDISKVLRNGVCGSACCMAGQAAIQTGHRLIMSGYSASDCIAEEDTGQVDEKGYRIWRDVPGAVPQPIYEVGASALGLTYWEGNRFFEGDNTLDRLHELANLFCAVRGLPLIAPDYGIGEAYADEDDDD